MTHCVILQKRWSLPMKRVIKRYENRKMYDSNDGKYVSLPDIAGMIRAGDDVKVIDNRNGKDITSLTLTNIILEEGRHGDNPLSSETLHQVIRWGGKVFDESMAGVKKRFDELLPTGINSFLNGNRIREFDYLKRRIEILEETVDKLTNYSKRLE